VIHPYQIDLDHRPEAGPAVLIRHKVEVNGEVQNGDVDNDEDTGALPSVAPAGLVLEQGGGEREDDQDPLPLPLGTQEIKSLTCYLIIRLCLTRKLQNPRGVYMWEISL